jgi:hydrogenase nickel incorporation protein HypA/HybF
MHEFALAQNIVEIVTESTLNVGKTKVTKVFLEIGEIAGVEESALITALESLIPQTMLSETSIEIQHIDGRAICQECKTSFPIHDFHSLCPTCSSYSKEIISGKEFNVKSIEAE